jgi:hypothetical protein
MRRFYPKCSAIATFEAASEDREDDTPTADPGRRRHYAPSRAFVCSLSRLPVQTTHDLPSARAAALLLPGMSGSIGGWDNSPAPAADTGSRRASPSHQSPLEAGHGPASQLFIADDHFDARFIRYAKQSLMQSRKCLNL